jgi:hypothetical protein
MDLWACRLVLAGGTLTQVFLPFLPLASTLWDSCRGVHLPIFILFSNVARKASAQEGRMNCYSNMMLCGLYASLKIHFH